MVLSQGPSWVAVQDVRGGAAVVWRLDWSGKSLSNLAPSHGFGGLSFWSLGPLPMAPSVSWWYNGWLSSEWVRQQIKQCGTHYVFLWRSLRSHIPLFCNILFIRVSYEQWLTLEERGREDCQRVCGYVLKLHRLYFSIRNANDLG